MYFRNNKSKVETCYSVQKLSTNQVLSDVHSKLQSFSKQISSIALCYFTGCLSHRGIVPLYPCLASCDSLPAKPMPLQQKKK